VRRRLRNGRIPIFSQIHTSVPRHVTKRERENALVPASVPRHPPLTVSLSTGTAMKESDNLVECLLPFHDTCPLFVLSLSAGTAIKESER